MVHFQLNSFEAQSFLQSVFNALGRGKLFRIGLIRIIQTCLITCKFYWKFQAFWTDPIAFTCFRMSSRFTRSVFCYWCWKCCAEAIDKKVFSPRKLELRTLGVWGTRDNHYTMVLLKISRLSSLGWFCNMLVVDVNAVSSNVCPQQRRSLLSTRALITGQVLWKFTFYCPDASALLFLALFCCPSTSVIAVGARLLRRSENFESFVTVQV